MRHHYFFRIVRAGVKLLAEFAELLIGSALSKILVVEPRLNTTRFIFHLLFAAESCPLPTCYGLFSVELQGSNFVNHHWALILKVINERVLWILPNFNVLLR